jgi:hypothetical protein
MQLDKDYGALHHGSTFTTHFAFLLSCRERRTKELMAAATKAVQQRRRPALATLETANAVAGVYAWVGGPLKAGARCILAYNCRWAEFAGCAGLCGVYVCV